MGEDQAERHLDITFGGFSCPPELIHMKRANGKTNI